MIKIPCSSLSQSHFVRKLLLASKIPVYALEFVNETNNSTFMNISLFKQLIYQIPIYSNDEQINSIVTVMLSSYSTQPYFIFPPGTGLDICCPTFGDFLKLKEGESVSLNFKIVKNNRVDGDFRFALVNSVGIDQDNNLIIETNRKSIDVEKIVEKYKNDFYNENIYKFE